MINAVIVISALLFFLGLLIIFTKKTLIMLLLGAEFTFNAINLLFVTLSKAKGDLQFLGEIFVIFNIAIAAIEVAIGISIAILVYKKLKYKDIEDLKELSG